MNDQEMSVTTPDTTATVEAPKKPEKDNFKEDFESAKEFWKRKHRIFDFGYLQYKSILTFNNLYGDDYLKAFGMRVYVPRTFQVIESIAAVLNQRKVDFVVEANNKMDEKKEKYLQRLDNIEWRRSHGDFTRASVDKSALLFGTGYYYNPFVDDKRNYHFPEYKKDETKPSDPEDGQPQTDQPLSEPTDLQQETQAEPIGPVKTVWNVKEVTRYKGMKPKALNSYYVFPDEKATSDDDWEHCYVYTPTSVKKARDFVVQNGWMTEEDAEKNITEQQVEYFDAIKESIDYLFEQPVNSWNRGDHSGTYASDVNNTIRPKNGMTAFIERFEEDYYEIRILGSEKPIYKDYNIYPHKRIPIIPVWDYKLPNEFPGLGEPEIMRWQQIEENKIHNLVLDAILMSLVQRYAVRADLLQDPTDLNFNNPFRPIKLKNLGGITVQQAIMPLQQPDIKQSPFELMALVKDIVQQTTGATDFVVSGNASSTDTATESNNLVAATTSRLKEKTRQMDEEALSKLMDQWHSCYPVFYTTEMDFRLRGSKEFVKYLPYNREEANENQELVTQAKEALNATGDTLEAVYLNAGYASVMYLSDLTGDSTVHARITDLELDAEKRVNKYTNLAKVLADINKSVEGTSETRRFDIFKLGEDALHQVEFINNPEDYILDQKPLAENQNDVTVPPTQNGNATIMSPPNVSPPPTPAPAVDVGDSNSPQLI